MSKFEGIVRESGGYHRGYFLLHYTLGAATVLAITEQGSRTEAIAALRRKAEELKSEIDAALDAAEQGGTKCEPRS
jgi:hypothetical protein